MDNSKSQIFIASSTEGLTIAYTVQELLDNVAECTVWDQGVFKPSSYPLPSIVDQVKKCDYGIFVFSIDDEVVMRGEEEKIVRDNVILELGIFIGALGLEKCFMIMPQSDELVHLPSDLSGLNILRYNAKRKDKNFKAALGPAVNQIRTEISS